MKRLLIYYNFIVVSIIVLVGFISVGSLVQLGVAVLFFPLFVYFALRVIPKRSRPIPLIPAPATAGSAGHFISDTRKFSDDVVKLKKEGVDIDRRAFLKLIGAAGLSVFLFSIFTKKAEAAFFGSVPGPGTVSIKNIAGEKIDPAEKQPTDGYRISEIDDFETSAAYYGFTDKDGAWFIMKEDTDTGAFRYVKGTSGFAAAWALRDDPSTEYDYFDEVFS
jgi:hypothetical protein